jgi:dynein intermediate chain, cytosolic
LGYRYASSTAGGRRAWAVDHDCRDTDSAAPAQETLELVNPGHAKTNEVSITCFDFPDDEASTFWIGTEEGGIHQAHRYDRAGSKAGLNLKDSYQSHAGPVTSLDFHPLRGPVDFSDLFLTTSVDWTVKLWRARSTGKSATALASTASGITRTISPLMTFEESDDHVYDAKWHPAHPAVFGTVDGGGKFDLWNLNADTEVGGACACAWYCTDQAFCRYQCHRYLSGVVGL